MSSRATILQGCVEDRHWQTTVLQQDLPAAKCSGLPMEFNLDSNEVKCVFSYEVMHEILNAESVFKHPVVSKLGEADTVESICLAFNAVHDILNWTKLQRNRIFQKMRVCNALYRVISGIDEKILLAKFPGHKPLYPSLTRSKCWHLHGVANILKFDLTMNWFRHSKFRHHRKIYEWL